MTFVCVLRLVVSWFPPRRIPMLTQLTGITGQLGQILSAIPLPEVVLRETSGVPTDNSPWLPPTR